MREEFHGIKWPEGPFKQLYGWGTINVNVWLPSLCELVGYDPAHQWTNYGTYAPAMQGLNLSGNTWVDVQGGNQWNYFAKYNTSDGGTAIMNVCKQEATWLRSPDYGNTTNAWRTTNAQRFDIPPATYSYAVHPAVLYNPERPVKQTGIVVFV